MAVCRAGSLLQIADLQKGLCGVTSGTVCDGTGNVGRCFVDAGIDDARIRCLQALAYGQFAGAAYLQPRGDGRHGGQQKRIGLDGIAEPDVRAENRLYGAHTRLQGIHIKDKGRRAVSGRKLL